MTEPMTLEFNLEQDNFDFAGMASSRIKKVLQQIGVRNDKIRCVAVASYEAEIDVIIHSQGGTLKAMIYPDRTELYLEDSGPGIPDVNLAMQEGYSTASDKVREKGFGAGMGLPNMKRCTDEFDIQSEVGKGTKIKMVIYHNK